MAKVNIDAAIIEAVKTRNAELADHIAETMMFIHGWTYKRLYQKANELTGISDGEWCELIREGEG
tara:strand:+ start:628 stop:822 length:195 start_codon:yes stop_codon:yes gene_type:complete